MSFLQNFDRDAVASQFKTTPEEFLTKYGRSLKEREWYYSVDNNSMKKEEFDTKKLRVLIGFLSPGSTREVSSTDVALLRVLREDYPDAFIDFCYFPDKEDLEKYDEAGCPILFGQISHKPAWEFDMIGISLIIVAERFNIPYLLSKSGIPLGIHERTEKNWPLIYAGGISAMENATMNGKFYNPITEKEDESLMDFFYQGEADEYMGRMMASYQRAVDLGYSRMDTIKEIVTNQYNIFFPFGYDVVWDDAKERIVKDVRKWDWVPPFVQFHVDSHADFNKYGFAQKIIRLNGQSVDSADILCSHGCVSTNICNFCAESYALGSWQEISHEDMIKQAHESRKYSASYSVSGFSFNLNMISHFRKSMAELSSFVPNIALVNQRCDALGAAPETIDMAKHLGVGKISTALEGAGPRIRNVFLNKGLPYSLYMKAMEAMVKNRFREQKAGMILTGYETEEDWDAFYLEMKPVVELSAQYGAKGGWRMNFCLTRDAMSPVQGHGLVRQDELATSAKVFGTRPSRVVKTHNNGVKDCLTLTTTHGITITGVPEHPVLVNQHQPLKATAYQFLKDLKKGDKIYGYYGSRCYGSTFVDCATVDYPTTLDVPKVKLLGWIAGNGKVNKDTNTVELCYPKSEVGVRAYHLTLAESLGYSVEEVTHNNRIGLYIYSEELVNLIQFLYQSTEANKTVPDAILQSPESVQKAYLNALFASRGKIEVDNYDVRIYLPGLVSTKASLLQTMLLNIGVVSIITSDAKYQTLEIQSDHLLNFANSVGFSGKKKGVLSSVYQTLLDGCKGVKTSGIFEMQVGSVESAGAKQTYGFTIEDSIYVTSGILSHNTPLVLYNHIGLGMLERRTAKNSFTGARTAGYWLAKARELGIRSKFNGRGYGTFLEQMCLDGGPKLTNIVVKYSLQGYLFYGFLGKAFDSMAQEIGSTYDINKLFSIREIETFISPAHRIHVKNQGNVLYAQNKCLQMIDEDGNLKSMDRLAAEGIWDSSKESGTATYCVTTYANKDSKCNRGVMKTKFQPFCVSADCDTTKEGFKVVAGPEHVNPEIDRPGYPTRPYINPNMAWKDNILKIHGCSWCTSSEEIKEKTQRKLDEDVDVSIVKEKSAQCKETQILRVVVQKKSGYDFIAAKSIPAIVMSRLMLLLDKTEFPYEPTYHSFGKNNLYKADDTKMWSSGLVVFDTSNLKPYSVERLKSVISDLNKELESCTVTNIYEVWDKKDKVNVQTEINTFMFKSDIPYSRFQSKTPLWRNTIKMPGEAPGTFTQITDNEILQPIISPLGSGTVGVITLRAKYNPYLLLSDILGVSLWKALESTQMHTLAVSRDHKGTMCGCGNENALIDLATNTVLPVGIACLHKKTFVVIRKKYNI